MPDELSHDEGAIITTAIRNLVDAAAPRIAGILGTNPPTGSIAAAQRADAENYGHDNMDDSAVAGAQEMIVWHILAALDHANGFATVVKDRRSVAPGALVRASIEALGLTWYQLSAPNVRTLLQRNLNLRYAELYFPAIYGTQIEDGNGGAHATSDRREALRALMKDRGYGEPQRISIPNLAAEVITAVMGSGGVEHYSQLSTIAHSALPMLAMHMSTTALRPSRSMVITAAMDLHGPLIYVVNRCKALYSMPDDGWNEIVLRSHDALAGLNATL